MSYDIISDVSVSRRSLLISGSAFALASTGAVPTLAGNAAVQQFSWDLLCAEMQALAAQPHQQPAGVSGFLADLNYDDYRLIRFRPDRLRWSAPTSPYRLAAFPPGWLFKEPVVLFEVNGGEAREMRFSTSDFEYLNDLADRVPALEELPGVAGFRLHSYLNRPDVLDELVAFVGASYFRALGRNSAYGLSARGLALNTATASGEEFPRFSRFYIDRSGAPSEITVFAALESPSVTGAYRFVIRPGAATTMDVTCRLWFRNDIEELGIAPLTSMYLFSEKSRAQFDDFRPKVHDSDGLQITRADGERIWRPLSNPPRLSGSYFAETSPRRFGLHQRDRRFESFQDLEANYHRRPSLDVEPLGDWGPGHVRLVEIPSDSEANDNIVAYWVPAGAVKAGESREFAYRLHWGDLPLDLSGPLAHVDETRAGHGGVAAGGVRSGERKFVIDFRGGQLDVMGSEAQIEAKVSVSNAEVLSQVVQRVPQTGAWRLFLDIAAQPDAVVELSAHLAGYGRKLSENWLYQWINSK
ncbi:glucan biosynthesis protein [Falsigemmobacter intermedius]|uniref:Glucan biosynthesis protein G n=1 Tax=Falsigemmobacter intermedius TaxID=1553448 RepID=A0A3S3VPM7_9RHOB|nr:glucan biosynthesis protein G [Falsigemmobacter intermedius]RWY40055.1 glucan biosynthesis protein G [Falsigemmobacter intermedius]